MSLCVPAARSWFRLFVIGLGRLAHMVDPLLMLRANTKMVMDAMLYIHCSRTSKDT